jgi:NADPH-dependent methylglyoxal reductase
MRLTVLPRDVEDVASVHIKALSPSVPGNERYLFHSRTLLSSDNAANFVREQYPQLKSRVPIGNTNAGSPPNLIKTDILKSEAAFGSAWRSWEETVADMANDIVKFEKEGRVEEIKPDVVNMKI